MAVHAHPDDESSKGAASTLRYVREGVDVMVVTCTDGGRGDILNPALEGRPAPDRRTWSRGAAQEMARAVEILGVQHAWLGFEDSGLPEGDPLPPLPEGSFALLPLEVAAEPLVQLIREFRPHVITTYDEQGGYPHPDHIRTHEISMLAFEAAADPAQYPDAGRAVAGRRRSTTTSRSTGSGSRAMHEARRRGRHRVAVRRPDRAVGRGGRASATAPPRAIECADCFEDRDRALLSHASQVDPAGFWFSIPMRDPAQRVVRPRTSSSCARRPDRGLRGRPVRRVCAASRRASATAVSVSA